MKPLIALLAAGLVALPLFTQAAPANAQPLFPCGPYRYADIRHDRYDIRRDAPGPERFRDRADRWRDWRDLNRDREFCR